MYLQDELERLAEMRAVDSDEGVANSLMRVAIAYLDKGQPELAADPLDEARYLCRKLENPIGLAQVCLRLADVSAAAADFEKAREQLAEAEGIFAEKEDLVGRVGALERVGRVELAAGREAEAARAWEEALGIVCQGGDLVGELLLVQYLAPLYRRMGRNSEAMEFYRRLGRLADTAGDPQRVALALVGLGTLLAQDGDFGQARTALEQAAEQYELLGQLERAAQVKQEMARLVGEAADSESDDKGQG